MSKQSTLEVVSQYTEAIAARNSDRMNSLRSEDYVRDFVYLDAFDYEPVSTAKISTAKCCAILFTPRTSQRKTKAD